MKLTYIMVTAILMMMFCCLAAGSEEYKYDLTNNSVKKYTLNLTWNDNECNKINLIEQFVCKTANYIGWLAFGGSKYFVEYGYTHPEYDFKFGMDLAMFSMYAIIFSVLFFPIILTIVLIYLGINYLKNKKEEGK